MRVETNFPAKEITKICPRCENKIVVETTNDIDVEMEYFSTTLDSFWDPPVKVPSFFCHCPICTEHIRISSSELTDEMKKKVLSQKKWYRRAWKTFKKIFN